jgi:hypothetical protein
MVQHQLEGKLISLNRSFNAAPDSIKGDESSNGAGLREPVSERQWKQWA